MLYYFFGDKDSSVESCLPKNNIWPWVGYLETAKKKLSEVEFIKVRSDIGYKANKYFIKKIDKLFPKEQNLFGRNQSTIKSSNQHVGNGRLLLIPCLSVIVTYGLYWLIFYLLNGSMTDGSTVATALTGILILLLFTAFLYVLINKMNIRIGSAIGSAYIIFSLLWFFMHISALFLAPHNDMAFGNIYKAIFNIRNDIAKPVIALVSMKEVPLNGVPIPLEIPSEVSASVIIHRDVIVEFEFKITDNFELNPEDVTYIAGEKKELLTYNGNNIFIARIDMNALQQELEGFSLTAIDAAGNESYFNLYLKKSERSAKIANFAAILEVTGTDEESDMLSYNLYDNIEINVPYRSTLTFKASAWCNNPLIFTLNINGIPMPVETALPQNAASDGHMYVATLLQYKPYLEEHGIAPSEGIDLNFIIAAESGELREQLTAVIVVEPDGIEILPVVTDTQTPDMTDTSDTSDDQNGST
jgi:drug/metabolite transporter superfamily protein YnfA